MTINDPDVVVTDIGLAVLGTWLAVLLYRRAARGPLRSGGVIVLVGLSVAALAGAAFHAIFTSGTTTRAAFLTWAPVPIGIAVVSATLIYLSGTYLWRGSPEGGLRGIAAVYFLVFVIATLFVDESFGMIVRLYAPALLLFLVTSTFQASRGRPGWSWLVGSLVISALAAVVQRAGIGIHPQYFDHNAVYHVLQAVGLVLMYRGFLIASAST